VGVCAFRNSKPDNSIENMARNDQTYKLDARLARSLRKRLTDAERVLWKHFRNNQFENVKFRRQQPIGPYVVDFISFSNKLVIEVDGGQHAEMQEKDRERDLYFINKGYRVLRFWNNEVLLNTEGVLHAIREEIKKPPSP
jgi:very-short-patch-repair endonuclease